MRTLRPLIALGTLLLAGFSSEARAGVIYDNTTTRQGSPTFTALELGSEVVAAGTDRLVTDLFIGVNQQGMAGTADLQARLYANDGSGGKPGTLLWQGPVLTSVHLTGGNDLIDFGVPLVQVPDTFTWTILISNTSPVAAGLPSYTPPTVGSSPANWFGNSSIGWTQTTPGGPFEARVVATTAAAVPEPSSALLLLTGAGVFLWRRRR